MTLSQYPEKSKHFSPFGPKLSLSSVNFPDHWTKFSLFDLSDEINSSLRDIPWLSIWFTKSYLNYQHSLS